jgi:hypothetical protein
MKREEGSEETRARIHLNANTSCRFCRLFDCLHRNGNFISFRRGSPENFYIETQIRLFNSIPIMPVRSSYIPTGLHLLSGMRNLNKTIDILTWLNLFKKHTTTLHSFCDTNMSHQNPFHFYFAEWPTRQFTAMDSLYPRSKSIQFPKACTVPDTA